MTYDELKAHVDGAITGNSLAQMLKDHGATETSMAAWHGDGEPPAEPVYSIAHSSLESLAGKLRGFWRDAVSVLESKHPAIVEEINQQTAASDSSAFAPLYGETGDGGRGMLIPQRSYSELFTIDPAAVGALYVQGVTPLTYAITDSRGQPVVRSKADPTRVDPFESPEDAGAVRDAIEWSADNAQFQFCAGASTSVEPTTDGHWGEPTNGT